MTVLMLANLVTVKASPINSTASKNVNMFDEELRMVLDPILVDIKDALNVHSAMNQSGDIFSAALAISRSVTSALFFAAACNGFPISIPR
eukprot:jgi/Pico_ML_1/51181/g2259.t1